jgi:hypothetical protein
VVGRHPASVAFDRHAAEHAEQAQHEEKRMPVGLPKVGGDRVP